MRRVCVHVHCGTVQGSRLPGEELAWGLAWAAGGEFEFAWQTARRLDWPEPRERKGARLACEAGGWPGSWRGLRALVPRR